MITIFRRFGFDMGHRVFEHEGKCRYPHGHRYTAEVEIWAADLNEMGMVVDFGRVKDLIGTWIDTNVDHAFCVWSKDVACFSALQSMESKIYLVDFNPTAENLARHLLERFDALVVDHALTVKAVRLYETPNCSALARQ